MGVPIATCGDREVAETRSERALHSNTPGPGEETNSASQRNQRRIFYYKKQIDAHTLMVIVLLDGEEIEGTIEWYDRGALKVNRKAAPNLLVLKRNIKYITRPTSVLKMPAD